MWIEFLKEAEQVGKKHYKGEVKDIHVGTALGFVESKIAKEVKKPEDGKAIFKRPVSKSTPKK